GRIRNTRKLLITAAVVMSVGLLGSSLVISTLVPADEITPVTASGELPKDDAGNPIKDVEDWPKKPAAGRALAYLAHAEGEDRGSPGRALCPFFGSTFGTIYDVSTILI